MNCSATDSQIVAKLKQKNEAISLGHAFMPMLSRRRYVKPRVDRLNQSSETGVYFSSTAYMRLMPEDWFIALNCDK